MIRLWVIITKEDRSVIKNEYFFEKNKYALRFVANHIFESTFLTYIGSFKRFIKQMKEEMQTTKKFIFNNVNYVIEDIKVCRKENYIPELENILYDDYY